MIREVIPRLAARVEQGWASCGWREDAFTEVASNALREPVALTFAMVTKELFAGEDIPIQRRKDEGFGQPALTLFHGARFDIEAICWHDATPAIHEHGFSGAFRMIEGASMQGRFRFAARARLGELELGTLQRVGFERLAPGMVVPIRAGAEMIHSSFHLFDPGMTLVVRTHQSSASERTFIPPGIAYDTAARAPALHKRLQMLDTLDAVAFAGYADVVADVIARGDAYETFAVLLRAGGHAIAQPFFESLLTLTRARFAGAGGRMLADAAETERRRGMLVRMRRQARDAEARLTIACLLDCRDREDFAALLARGAEPGSAPPDPLAVLARLLQPDEHQRPLASMALAALLENTHAGAFIHMVTERADARLGEEHIVRLSQYLERLRGIAWLAPLLPRAAAAA